MSLTTSRGGKQAISDNVRLIEWFDGDDLPSHIAALCSEHGCENLARGFRSINVPVCFDHGASEKG
jgi:hypothetical protein